MKASALLFFLITVLQSMTCLVMQLNAVTPIATLQLRNGAMIRYDGIIR